MQPMFLFAAVGGTGEHIGESLLWAAGLLLVAFVFGRLFVKLGQAAVLAWIALGIGLSAAAPTLLKNGIDLEQHIAHDPIISALAGLGVIVLLFVAGLENTYGEMAKVGVSAFLVAILGMAVPFGLGFGLALLFGMEVNVAIFIGAAMTATSVGITKSVLTDLGLAKGKDGRTVLAAAVIDDIGGLIILAVVVGLVSSGGVDAGGILLLVVKAIALVVGGKLIGITIAGPMSRLTGRYLKGIAGMAFFGFVIMLIGAGVARLLGLEEIIGAFVAGLMLEEVHWKQFHHDWNMEEVFKPFEEVLVPLFFVLVGMQVDVATLLQGEVLLFGSLLSLLAIIGKVVSGLGAGRGSDRMMIGLSMVPRGEVGIVFALIGITTAAVLSPAQFSQIIFMVVVTTFFAPLALSLHAKRKEKNKISK